MSSFAVFHIELYFGHLGEVLTTKLRKMMRPKDSSGVALCSAGVRDQAQRSDQLMTEIVERGVIEVEATLDPPRADVALGDEAPDDLLQHPRKLHGAPPPVVTGPAR
jgi:hypothetical protein